MHTIHIHSTEVKVQLRADLRLRRALLVRAQAAADPESMLARGAALVLDEVQRAPRPTC